jgi:hypothetical protein
MENQFLKECFSDLGSRHQVAAIEVAPVCSMIPEGGGRTLVTISLIPSTLRIG